MDDWGKVELFLYALVWCAAWILPRRPWPAAVACSWLSVSIVLSHLETAQWWPPGSGSDGSAYGGHLPLFLHSLAAGGVVVALMAARRPPDGRRRVSWLAATVMAGPIPVLLWYCDRLSAGRQIDWRPHQVLAVAWWAVAVVLFAFEVRRRRDVAGTADAENRQGES